MFMNRSSLNAVSRPLVLAMTLSILSAVALAETAEFKISGMTCGSCVKMIKAKVCADPSLESCDVKVGSMTLKSKPGAKLDVDKFTQLVGQAGEYQVTGHKFSEDKSTPATAAEPTTKSSK